MNPNIEHRLDLNEKKIKELEVSHQKLRDLTQELHEILNLKPEQINHCLNDSSRFSDEHLEELKKLRTQLDEKLQKELSAIRNPKELKKTYQERQIGSHWLFVR